ncbi:PDR/VanB family oxidoreductase [Pollutimonas bauzanensis]|uniref:PDR/VanB family oxidoreductase n=1 Tax=Pollutimonas bauzanensis TaxID=658167 RepID=UPI00333F5E69
MNDYPSKLRIASIQRVAQDVRLFTLVDPEGSALPEFTAGSHIELLLANGLGRSYSLFNAPSETACYQIAVHNSPTGTGGSRYMHEALNEGDVVSVTGLRNHFPLHEEAPDTCFIAGGIGITPLMAMAQRLNTLGKRWELHYCARTPDHAAFVSELRALAEASGNALHCHFDQIPGGQPLDISHLVQTRTADTHLYCCGPNGMLNAFETATAHLRDRSHVEYFSPKAEAALDGGFAVELARSGKTLQVAPGQTILEVVTAAGVNVQTSCREGICGSCETRIISGEADHRDSILTPEEQAENTTMMICCSGAKTSKLVLDL